MTSAVTGADSSGQGAVQIRFVTRSGTNQYQTSVYEYFQHKSLNTNTFFNRLAGLPKPRRTIHNYGGRIGGPIVIPGVVDGRGKAFFFFNQEETFYAERNAPDADDPQCTSRAARLLRLQHERPDDRQPARAGGANGHVVHDRSGDRTRSSRRSARRSARPARSRRSTRRPNVETFNYLVRRRLEAHNPTGRASTST